MSNSPIRLSEKLKNEIIVNVNRTYGDDLDAVNRDKPDLGDTIYEILYGKHLEYMSKLPETFFRRKKELEVRNIEGKFSGISFTLSSKRPFAFTHPKEGPVRDAGYSDKIDIDRAPETEDILNRINEWQDRKKAVVAIRDAAAASVRRLLSRNKSLAPVTKDFPPVVELLPYDVRKKVSVPQHKLSSVIMELDPALKELATRIAMRKLLKGEN